MGEQVVNRSENNRYELIQDGRGVAYAEYRERDGSIEFTHTVVHPDHRGRGLAAALVSAALDDVRDRGLRAVPTCWYVARFVDTHPGYRDLVA